MATESNVSNSSYNTDSNLPADVVNDLTSSEGGLSEPPSLTVTHEICTANGVRNAMLRPDTGAKLEHMASSSFDVDGKNAAADTRTEKEKMLAGDLYRALSPESAAEQLRCKNILFQYNQSKPDETRERTEMLKKLLGKAGVGAYIEPPFFCDYGYNIEWGDNSYANCNFIVLDVCKVKIGDNVLFGPYVKIFGATHPTDPQTRLDGLEYGGPVTIGNNVWVGGGAIINAGVTIGDNSVIGAGSIVTRNIPANVVAVGNPCRVLKQLNPPTKPKKG